MAFAQSPFQPSLTDPQNQQRFGRQPDAVTRDQSISGPDPAAAGNTGFDSTGSIRRKKKKPRPGERNLGGKPAPLPSPPPPSNQPPQIAARATYADVYKPPDAPVRRPLVPYGDAFEPLGVRAGDFILRPSIEVSRGYDSNPARVPNGRSSQFTLVTPELVARSDWSNHELGANLRGSYSAYDSMSSLNRPAADAKVFGRIDASRDTKFDLEGRFSLGTDYPGSPNVGADIAQLPISTTFGGTAGVTQRFNHLELSAKATADRTRYGASKLTDGSSFSNRDRDYNQYGGQLRAGYEFVPGLKPFAEIAADKRVHDLKLDRNGTQRDSQGLTPRIGTTFELTQMLTGEISVGYLTRQYADPGLKALSGIVADASLVWVASGLTTATLTASSRAEESVVAGVSGALRRDAGLQVDHAFRRWLIGTLKFGYGFDEYVGMGREDQRTSLGAAVAYKFNREFSVKGEFRQEWMRSNTPGVDYSASVFLLGVKLQR